jgi:autotransporter-associated beta strand protein
MISRTLVRPSLRPASLRIAGLFACLFLLAARLVALPAFPGAEGFGANASGGRGGTVYHVTNLNDSGAGSFRDAISVSGRTIVFDVGGIIVASSPLVVKANITIAGQTAPGEGITIYGDRISYSEGSNTITRYLRFREGINGDSGTDAVGAAAGNLMMFDHVSAAWGRDETFSLSGTPSNVTLQDCIIGQGLLIHSAGGLMQTSGGVSIFRCLYIDNWMRNPKVKGVNDYQNNVVYNWGGGGGYIPAGDSAGLSYTNVIGNYFIAGPNTGSEPAFKTGNQNFNIYHAGNFQDLNVNGLLDGTPVTDANFPTLNIVPTAFAYAAPATVLSAQQALSHILAHAGASLHRDHADSVMLTELTSVGTVGAHISNESEIGGIGTVAGGVAAKDTDGDGMPDWWEEAAGTNPLVADNNGDINGDGYTNLENYLNALAPAGVPAATIAGLASDTGSSTSDGITSVGQLIFHGTAAPGAIVTLARIDTGVIGTTTANGSGQWTFDYSGTPLADRYYAFFATVALPGGLTSPPTRAFVVKVDTAAAAAPVITSIVTSPALAINGTSEPGSLVAVTLSGTGVVATATTDALGNWSAPYTGAPLAPGVYTFTAAATDLAGNGGAASAPYVINTGISAPVFTAIVSDTGASSSDQITNDPTLIFNGTSAANAVITVTRVGTGVIGTATATAGGTWSFSYIATTLPAGVSTFTATASTGGSSSPASPAFLVTIDTTRPVISSLRRLNPATAATTVSTLVYRVTFSESVSGVDLADFSLTLASGVTASLSSLSPVSPTVYDVTVIGAAGDGTVRLDLKSSGTGIVDVAGNAISGGYTAGQTYTLRLPGSGVWISDDDGQLWSNSANWENGIVASGTGATADFSSRNLNSDLTVQLDSARTVGRVVFGDIDFGTPASWTLSDQGTAANVLTLAGPTPNLQVDAATTSTGDTADVPAANAYPANLDVTLAGTAGFTKTGVGTLQILKPATITGPLTITKGIVQVGPGGVLAPSSVSIATSQQLRIAGGTFTTAGNVTWTSGTGTGIIVSDGLASFQKIIPSNTRNSFVKVTGGTMTATDISFPRSGDSESQAIAAGILISGGDSTVGSIGLGTVDSWGAMTISGGRMTVTGALNVGFQRTSTRGGVVGISAGELNVTDSSATGGMILAHNPGGSNANTNNVAKFNLTGGVSNIARLTLGYDATSSAGSATVSLAGGELNLGSGGLVKNGASGLATSVTLTNGTLGAFATWTTSHPLVLAGTPATVALRAASATGIAHDFTLSGALTGSGGFAKTGAGTVTLAAANTFTGDVAVVAGTLAVNGGIAPGGGFVVSSGGTLAGSGVVNRALVLEAGGAIAPASIGTAGPLSGGSLAWNGGGTLALDLGATGVSDTLILSGVLTRGTSGAYSVALNPGAGFAAGNVYTLATFASTNFVAGDFTASGLPAGYAGAFSVTGGSLQLTIVGTPAITSPATAAGTYGAPFGYTIAADNVPTAFSATGLPAGLSLDPVTGLISGAPAAVGTFNVTLAATNLAGTGTASLTLTIAKAPASVALASLAATYDGAPHAASATTTPAGLTVTFTYDGSAAAPASAGSYAVVATIVSPFYSGSATGTLVIAQAAQAITFPNPGSKAYGDVFALTATASSGLPVSYSVVSGPATVAGSTVTTTGVGSVVLHAVQAGNANYLAAPPVDVTFSVAKSSATTITLAGLVQTYNGTPRAVTATTDPTGLTVTFTYNGSATAPTLPGNYAVVATIDDANYSGSATGTLYVTVTALVRHAPVLNGDIDGSVQVLLPESTTLNGGALVSGDLLVPGTPTVQLNGHPTYGSTLDGTGAATPSAYTITLNGNAVLGHVVRRTDALTLPTVAAPPAPAGTRSVTLNSASDPTGDFATLRNLTLNGGVPAVAVPAGTYGSLTANSGGFILGVVGATTPAVYNLQSLTLNGTSSLQIVGPVILTLANGVNANGNIGAAAHPEWLVLRFASGGLTLNGNVNVAGSVLAPNGTVTINGNSILHGQVTADRLTLNGNALLQDILP